MLANPLLARWDIVAATQHALRVGGASLRNVPALLKRLIQEDSWREYLSPKGEVLTFVAFRDFLGSPWGLDTTLDMLLRVCGEDLEAVDLLDKVTTAKPGNREGINQYADSQASSIQEPRLFCEQQPEQCGIHDIVMNSTEKKELPSQGNSRTYALRRLREHKPHIHARVLAGELSPHQGMLEAGFRHKPTPLEQLHRYWRKVAPDDRLRFLCEMLTPNERRAIALGFEEDDDEPHRDR